MNWRRGEFYVWISAAMVTITLLMAFALMAVVMVNALGHFWPSALHRVELRDGTLLLGETVSREPVPESDGFRRLYKVGNRKLYGADFRWIDERDIAGESRPEGAVGLERQEYGNFYGFLSGLRLPTLGNPQGAHPWARLRWALDRIEQQRRGLDRSREELSYLSREMEDLRLDGLKLKLGGAPEDDPRRVLLRTELARQRAEFERRNEVFSRETGALRSNVALFRDVENKSQEIALLDVVRAYRPNIMSVPAKGLFYLSKLKELFLGDPRESNTEGGLFPAIFGTVMLVLLMSMFSVPLGIVAAVYLREYARDGFLVGLVRIAVYNLAGVPSIVFGIFGLGFFVYGIGSSIDQLFFAEKLPTPTFGTGGILWASLTLALLTVPVVIVATEEGLSSIPRGTREASLALGATQFQTLMRVVLPMAAPGMVTGFILAMARAAGEVAPLMITGVVKLASSLPVDGTFPFLHLDRKFMHLGFHIYDVGFQSPNVEAAKPMVYMTTLVLVLVVLVLSMAGIYLRNSMRKRFQGAAF